ncbi:MAG: type II toxin-antitoxin system VapC family toxin [Pyrinomonadaceae bacterium]|nr:type II toxin-antitoxin system VapC family toxin [Pyrinomonadaceae bacterium]
MAAYFLDTSAVVKRYVRETGSDLVDKLAASENDNDIFLADITRVEMAAAIARRLKGGSIAKQDAEDALLAFEYDLTSRYAPVEISQTVLADAVSLATKYALRGYDAVQLAVALGVNTDLLSNKLTRLVIVSADAELNAAAKTEGLTAENPNDHE